VDLKTLVGVAKNASYGELRTVGSSHRPVRFLGVNDVGKSLLSSASKKLRHRANRAVLDSVYGPSCT